MDLNEILASISDFSTERLPRSYVTKYLGPYTVNVYADTATDPGFWAVAVKSSKPNVEPYTVILERDGKTECDCKSAMYRGTCRHQTEIQNYLKERLTK